MAEDWFYSNDEEQSLAINEGKLRFISARPDEYILTSEKTLTITPHSLTTGWIELEQCYYNLDPVPSSSITYRYRNIKNLSVVSSRNIAQTKTKDQTIELVNLQRNARLCVRAEVQLLELNSDFYRLRSGPYHRKFLDGYYPFHLTLTIRYPGNLLNFAHVTPAIQKGFNVTVNKNQIVIDCWFEGELTIEMDFAAVDK